MVKTFIHARDIERWVPKSLSEVIGCSELKLELAQYLRPNGRGPNILISGDPGTGKTAAVKAFVRTLSCSKRTTDPLLPCEECESCRTFDVRYPELGLFASLNPRVTVDGAEPLHFCPINCGGVTEAQLRELLNDLRYFRGLILIYLDEAHRLKPRNMNHLLLPPIEETEAIWVASSALAHELDPMLLRRFAIRTKTSLPDEEELLMFLAHRCNEWKIKVDDIITLQLLSQRSQGNVSECLSVLARAAANESRLLAKELVLRHPFHTFA